MLQCMLGNCALGKKTYTYAEGAYASTSEARLRDTYIDHFSQFPRSGICLTAFRWRAMRDKLDKLFI